MTPTEALKAIAGSLALDDDAPEAVVSGVADLAARYEASKSAAATLTGVEAMVKFQTDRADQFREGLEDAASAMERARDDLRGVTGAQLLQLRATATRLAGDLNSAASAADTALEEPAPPEVEEAD